MDGQLPTAVASGIDAPDAVRPRRVGIVVGVVMAVYITALFGVVEVPTRIVGWLGGPSTDIGRFGGLHMVYVPPSGTPVAYMLGHAGGDDASVRLDGPRLEGSTYIVDVARIDREHADYVARVLSMGGLTFHEVVESQYLIDLQRLGLAEIPRRAPRSEPWIDIDQWRPDEGGGEHTDYYLIAHSREAIERTLAEAQRLGWRLPDDLQILLERDEPPPEARDKRPTWRTYVIAREAPLGGESIASAIGSYDPNTNRPIVLLDFDRAGAQKFGDMTARLVGHKIATVLGGLVVSAPIINGAIRGGRASINMGGSDPIHQEKERDALVQALSAGALPTGGKVLESTYVPPASQPVREWAARLALAIAGGLAAGVIAFLLVRVLVPVRRRDVRITGTRGVGVRIAWTVGGVLLLLVGLNIILPWINEVEMFHVLFGRGRHGDATQMSIFALGLAPIVTSFVAVELIASIVPRWRPLRDTPAGRLRLGRTVAIVAALCALVQGYFVASYIQQLTRSGLDIIDTGMDIRLLVMVTLAGGTAVLAWVAGIINARGVGNGFIVLIVAGWLYRFDWEVMFGLSAAQLLALFAGVVVVVVVVRAASEWRIREPGAAAIPLPASGIIPVSYAAGVGVLVNSIALMVPRLPPWLYDALEWVTRPSIGFVMLAVFTALWCYAFARPGRRRDVFARVGSNGVTRAAWLRATATSFAILAALWGISRFMRTAQIGAFVDIMTLSVITVAICDFAAELRARRGDLVAVWVMHDPLLVDVARDQLAGIPHCFRGVRTRTLLALFGAYVPVEVFVPRDQADAARDKLTGVFSK